MFNILHTLYEIITDDLYEVITNELYEIITNDHSRGYCLISFLASIVTIAGFVSILVYCQKIRISKQCQKKIIIDLIRHLYINCVIIEIIRAKLTKKKFTIRPTDGVFSRFAVLDTDMCLDRFSVNSRNFVMIHEICLLFRNYNIVAGVAEKHFADPNISVDLKKQDMTDLFSRAVKVTKMLFDLNESLKLGITKESIVRFLEQDLRSAKKGPWPEDIGENDILPRDKFDDHSYYDEMGLKQIFDQRMLKHATTFYFTR